MRLFGFQCFIMLFYTSIYTCASIYTWNIINIEYVQLRPVVPLLVEFYQKIQCYFIPLFQHIRS